MAYNLQTARSLCTAPELELVRASFATGADVPPRARLKPQLIRARALRDKYRDLWRRQRLANRDRTGTKLGARPGSNARTKEKAQLFAETLARLERQWASAPGTTVAKAKGKAKGKAKAARGAAPPLNRAARRHGLAAALAPKAKRGKRSAAPRTGFVSEKALQAARRQRLQNTRAKTLQAHVRARGQRNQARRDSRPR
jgi:hypothetical protein